MRGAYFLYRRVHMNRHDSFFFGSDFPFDFFDNVFADDAWKDFGKIFTTLRSTASFPPYNVYALKDGSAMIKFALAGYTQDDISIRAIDGKIIVENKKKAEEPSEGESCGCGCEDDGCRCFVHGIREGSFRAIVPMETRFDLSKCVAKMKNGMLEITVPLAEERKEKNIDITIE